MQVPEVNPTTSLYETDFYAWTQEQMDLLRDRQWSQVDLHHLIDEVESLANSSAKSFVIV